MPTRPRPGARSSGHGTTIGSLPDNAKSMRILYVCHSKEIGGAELYLEGLVRYASQQGSEGNPDWDVDVICRRDTVLDDWASRMATAEVTVHRLDLNSPDDFVAMLRRIRRASVVHLLVAYPAGKYQLAVALLAALGRRPLIATHQIAVDLRDSQLSLLRRTFWRVAFRLYGAVASRNIASSRVGWDVLVRRYGFAERTTHLIYNGADLKMFMPLRGSARSEARHSIALAVGANRWDSGALLACTVARFTGQKGLPDLVDAAAEVLKTCPQAMFVLVGDGDLKEALTKRVHDRALDGHFWFAGRRALAEIALWLGASDLFVLSSHDEGMPLALLEAMAAGCPAVATDVGGVRDVIHDDTVGRMVPARNVQALADAIVQVLSNDKERRLMSEAARDRVISTFDVQTCYRRTTYLYREVS